MLDARNVRSTNKKAVLSEGDRAMLQELTANYGNYG